jgi:hypothetical protein
MKMESPAWLSVGAELDLIHNCHDAAVNHFVKRRWSKLDLELARIEQAAAAARKQLKEATVRKSRHPRPCPPPST